MSQLPNSPKKPEAHQPASKALAEYHSLMAAGHFKPSSSITLPTSAPRASTPQIPTQAPSAPPIGIYAPPRTTPPRTTPPLPPPTNSSSPYAFGTTMPPLAPTHYQPNPTPRRTYGPFPSAPPPQQPPLYTPNSLTRDMISARLQDLLRDKLPEFSPPNIVMLSTQLTNRVIHLGVNQHLGPDGLSGVNDISMVIGNEGRGKYMALTAMAPTALRILLRGATADFGGKDPLKDTEAMEWLRQSFYNAAVNEWRRLRDAMTGNGGR